MIIPDMNAEYIDNFTRWYMETLLWSCGDSGKDLESLEGYNITQIEPHALMVMVRNCTMFCMRHNVLLRLAGQKLHGGHDSDHCGHDFALEINGHGIGFLDRNMGDVGDKLSKACKEFDGISLFVTDSDTVDIR